MEETQNIKQYLELYKLSLEVDDTETNLEDLENLYYELNEDELAYLEMNGFC